MTTSPTNRRYLLQSLLGRGGMGTVYHAYDRLTKAPVALKQVNIPVAELNIAPRSSDPALALALEFRTLAGLRHPNIVAVLDYGFDEQRCPYYTMQFIEDAHTIKSYGDTCDDSGKIRLLVELLQALVYLHRSGVIHCDLKPGNVLVTGSGSVKVMDFGLALQRNTSTQLAGFMRGTLAYMAPELLSDAQPSIASDLYAVGVIAYQMFTGALPFEAANVAHLLVRIVGDQPDLTVLPPHLQFVVGRLLSKDPADRYRRAEEVIEALCAAANVPPPQESALLRESFLQASMFVGRDTELAELKEALEGAFQGRGSFWLIGGESGVGKSRLLDELRTRALVRGALVVRGQAVTEGGLPYHLWRDAARRLVLATPISDLEAAVLKPLIPDIAALLERDIPDAPVLPGEASQQRLILTLVDLFKRQTVPVTILLEDLQWAEDSLAPISQMIAVRDQLPHLMLIGSYRDDERPSLPTELEGVRVLKLPRLSEAAVAQLAHSMLGETGDQPEVVNLLQRETEGNAFFMVETVRALAEEAGTLSAIGTVTLPSFVFAGGVKRIVQRRLSRIPQPFRPLLKLMAVAGRTLDSRILHGLAVSTKTDGDAFLAAGANASIFEIVDGNWRFNHDKLREGVISELSAEETAGLHRVVAEALEAAYPHDPAYYEVLLDHWRAAGDTERELSYLIPLTRQLTKLRADYNRARLLAARGQSLLSADDPRMAVLLNLRSSASWHKSEFAEAEQWAAQALDVARRVDVQASVAESLSNLGLVALEQGNTDAARDFFHQSLDLFRAFDDRQGIADCLKNLGVTAAECSDYGTAQAFYQQSTALYRELNNLQGIADNLNNLGMAARIEGNYVVEKNCYQQSLALYLELGDKRGISGSLNSLGVAAILHGDYAEAHGHFQQSLALRREMGNKRGVAGSLSNLGGLAGFQGDYARARDYYQQSLVLRREMGDQRGIADTQNSIGMAASLMGDYAAAHDYLQQSLALRRKLNDKRGIANSMNALGTVVAIQGDSPAAQTYFQQSLALFREIGDQRGIALNLDSLGELLLDQRSPEIVDTLREGLRLSLELQALPLVLSFLITLARRQVQTGKAVQAATLAGLIGVHPALSGEMRQEQFAKLVHELEAVLPASDQADLREQGSALTLEPTAHELIKELDAADEKD